MKRTFEQKLQIMTGAGVLAAMIEGLENPETEIDMHTYGEIRHGICMGCAATNAICKIGVATGTEYAQEREQEFDLLKSINGRFKTINNFESAINSLRWGDIECYNNYIDSMGLENLKLPPSPQPLPELETEDYKEGLPAYKEYLWFVIQHEGDEKA